MSTLVPTGNDLIVDTPIQIIIEEGINPRLGFTITSTCCFRVAVQLQHVEVEYWRVIYSQIRSTAEV